ncbi:MAG TPA: DUF4331 family protein [Gemmatimonadales bacterium]|jgi:hypothetical protein|nr:DUF4331 family protein [Gemmatimonadales bacterium]
MTLLITRSLSRRLALLAALAGASALAAGCSDNNETTGFDPDRNFQQVQRLGNPLVSEALLAKRNHPLHGAIGPAEDTLPGTDLRPEIKNFIATVAGRSATVQNTVAAVLLPDMLIVDTSKDPATSGWLSWALASGWGGRNLEDDVVDAALSAVFGPLLDANNVTPGYATDNVANDNTFSTTFPYLAPPN